MEYLSLSKKADNKKINKKKKKKGDKNSFFLYIINIYAD